MDHSKDEPIDTNTDPTADAEPSRPELSFDPGEIAPCIASPFPDAELTEEEEKALSALVDRIGNMDVAARRFEVEQAWMSRLFDRGYQYLWPRRGGGWIYNPVATDYQHGRSGQFLYGNETNIYATYGEIITAALTRDIPTVRFEPQNPSSDADITAKDAATNYARVFSRNNDLLDLHQQLAYYLRTDGRALIVTDHIIDAQQFGRCDPEAPEPVVPETEEQVPDPFIYVVRHGETDLNQEDKQRGRSDVPINEKGERQIDRAGDWLKDKGIKVIVSSPVERALSSAELLSQKLGVQLEVDDRLASLNIGNLAGEDSESSMEDMDEAFDEHPDQPIAGGESPEDFQQRVQAAVMDWLSNPDKPVAFVVHDSVISQIMKMFQGDDVPPSSATEPGWIVGITPNPDGTFKPSVVYPVTPPETSIGEQRGRPRGQEVAKVYGKLEHKVPFNAPSGKLEDCQWVQVSGEYDITYAKSMFPDKADKIKPGGSASGENELDRIARINATLALEASYVTGDSMVRDCTIQRTWVRPGHFMGIENLELRSGIFQKLPDGALVIKAGDEFIKARNESMDDHCTLVHAFPGSGMNRLALCSKLLSIQKRLNNWMDLLDQYFIKCVPMRYMASGVFDVNAVNSQGTVVGGYIPFQLEQVPPNRGVQDVIWMEGYPTAQPMMGEFIKWFTMELPQMLSHALPSLFGSESNLDSWRGAALQRDQALESNSTPWHNIQVATAKYFKQAVQLAARCQQGAIEGIDVTGSKVRVELADLKGNILAFPEVDANFPESSIQQRSRFMELVQNAANPLVQKLMSSIKNQIQAVQEGIQIPGLNHPDQAGTDKQMGEFEILLKTGPVPNPEYIQAQQAIQEATQQIQSRQEIGVHATPQEMQSIAQMEQQLQSIPPQLSSVQVKDTDNHQAEAECCLDKINSPDGRKLADGNEQDRAAFANLTLHYQEHEAKITPKTDIPKPPSVTINYKDLPPDPAAKLLNDIGLETTGSDIVQNREFAETLKKSGKIGGPVLPGQPGSAK